MAQETDDQTGQPIGSWQQRVGLGHVGSYQSAGVPYITGSNIRAEINSGSIQRFEFPRVAKSVTVQLVPPSYVGHGTNKTEVSPVYVFFGEPKDASGTDRQGNNTFLGVDAGEVAYTGAPVAFIQQHAYLLRNITGSANKQTFGVRTDHVNVMCVAAAGAAVTGAFQVYAELTNIPAARMPVDYISGSGVNIY